MSTEQVDTGSPDPYYEQLADIIRRQIASGQLKPRQKIPTQEALVDAYKVSRGTVLRSTEMLASEGLLVWSKGKGLFVANQDVVDEWKKRRSVG